MKFPSMRWQWLPDLQILVLAVGFGIGPQVAAENLLADMISEMSGQSTDHQGLTAWQEDSLEFFLPKINKQGCRLLLNFGVVEPLPFIAAQYRVWIDCVDWLRTELPLHLHEYDLLLREQFFPSTHLEKKGPLEKWHSIAPLIRPLPRSSTPDPDLVVLSFGGVATPYSTTVHAVEMPMAFLKGVHKLAKTMPQKKFEVFLPRKLLMIAKTENHQSNIYFSEISRENFHVKLRSASHIICQPGLYTPFEAILSRIPIKLTYPMSFTQYRQAIQFTAMGISVCDLPNINSCLEDFSSIEHEKNWFFTMNAIWGSIDQNVLTNNIMNFLSKSPEYTSTDKSTAQENPVDLIMALIL